MCLVATSMWPAAIVVFAVIWIAVAGRHRGKCCGRSPLTMVAIASIVGGLLIFTHKADRSERTRSEATRAVAVESDDVGERMARRIERRVADRVEELEAQLDRIPDYVLVGDSESAPTVPTVVPKVEPMRIEPAFRDAERFPVEHHGPREIHVEVHDPGMPKWMLVALGTVLVIGGWLLVNRDRSRPKALKAVTLLGAGATCFILFSLFQNHAPRRITRSHDRIVKDSGEVRHDSSPTFVSSRHDARRAGRAKRPMPRDASLEDMPRRAGGIPLDEEAKRPAPDADGVAAAGETSDDQQQATQQEKPERTAVRKKGSAESRIWEELVTTVARTIEKAIESADEQVERQLDKADTRIEEVSATVEDEVLEQEQSPRVETVVDTSKPESQNENDDSTSNEPQPAPAAQPSLPVAAAEPADDLGAIDGGRPEWIDMPGVLLDSVYRVSVKSGLYVDEPECRRHLEEAAKQRVDAYIESYLGEGSAELVDMDRDYINRAIRQAEFHEIEHRSVGPMHQIHALLEIDDADRDTFHARWRQAIVTDRLWYVGSAAAVVLALLSTFYGYLKLDVQTGGAHKGKLQLAATLVALVAAAGALLARWAVPF